MPVAQILLLKPTDRTLCDLFNVLENISEISDKSAAYSIPGVAPTLSADGAIITAVYDADRSIISSVALQIDVNSYIRYSANFTIVGGNLQSHPFYSVLQFQFPDNQQTRVPDERVVELQLTASRFIEERGLSPASHTTGEPDATSAEAAALAGLRQLAASQIEKTDEFFRRLTKEFDQRRQELDAEMSERRAQLDAENQAERDRLVSEADARLAVLDERAAALDAAKKEIDDRNNTHARRAVREDLLQTIENRQSSFAVSADTRKLRTPIHLVYWLLLLVTGSGVAWSLYTWGVQSTDTWGPVVVTSALKAVTFTFAFVTTAGLYITWLNRWFDRHAEAQFQTKQFEIDINRATWAVEAALEWKGAQGEQMPDALLAGITKHLFEAAPGEAGDGSPLEALASSILGSAANLKLNTGGTEVTLDRKSMKEIKKGG